MTGSKQIIEFLKNAYQNGEGFTSPMIAYSLPTISKGSITGLLAKLLEKDYLKRSGTNNGVIVYTIEKDLSTYGLRNYKDETYVPTFANRTPRTPKKQKLVDTLFSVITELEKLKHDLSDFTTKELLHELEKRTTKSE